MTKLYQVEFTNFCNLKCSYCPHPRMTREKGHISEKTLSNVIPLCENKVAIHHFGEVFLHPKLEDRLRQLAEAKLLVVVNSNAVLLERNLDLLLSIPTIFEIRVSAHNWVTDTNNVDANAYITFMHRVQERSRGTNVSIHFDYNYNHQAKNLKRHNWTDGEKFNLRFGDCFFLKSNSYVILWNGDIATCCADYDGGSAKLNVNTDISELPNRVSMPWAACATCTLTNDNI